MTKRMTYAAGAVAAIAGLVPAAEALAAFPGANGRIVFERPAGRQPDVLTIAPDGTGERKILATKRFEEEPRWSPDGKRIVFARSAPGGYPTEVWTAAADGGDLRQVTRYGKTSTAPTWTADGLGVTFFTTRDFPEPQRDAPPPPAELYTVGLGGSPVERLTRDRQIQVDPAWSPDGQKLVYGQWRAVPGQPGVFDNALYVRDAAGARVLLPFSAQRDVLNASWSPDGQWLAYEIASATPKDRAGKGRQSDIAIVRADGTGARKLTSTSAYETHPAWSPDGTRIAFTSDLHQRSGRQEPLGPAFEIYTMAPDGTEIRRLTRNRVPDTRPDWQPLLP